MMQDCCTLGVEFGQYNYPGAYCFPFASNYITPLIISRLFYYEGYFGRICQYLPSFWWFRSAQIYVQCSHASPILEFIAALNKRTTYGITHN